MRALLVAAAFSLASAVVVSAQDVRLPVGDARVTGRVIAQDTGAPLVGATVTLMGLNLPPDLAYRTTTDASGAFDFQNVYAPREYRVSAVKAGFYSPRNRTASSPVYAGEPVVLREGQSATGVTVPLIRGGVITGRVVDAHGDPVDAIRVYPLQLQYAADGSRGMVSSIASDVTDDLGQFRVSQLVPGDYLVVAAGRSARAQALPINIWSPLDLADTVPTFYPGTVDVSQAQVVSLAGGEQFVQIVLRDQRAVSVSGLVRRADGDPGAGMRVGLSASNGFSYASRSVTVGRDGSFAFTGIPPGVYGVEAYAFPANIGPDAVAPPVTRPPEQGSIRVTVDAEDVRDLSIVTSPGASVRGTVVFERPFTGQSFQLSANPVDASMGTVLMRPVSDRIGPDGVFTISGVAERSRLAVVNPAWAVKSVTVDGRDIGDGPLELGGRARLTGVQVTVTDRLPELSGLVVDDRKRPLSEQLLVILRLDGTALVPADRIMIIRSDVEGRFVERRLRSGSYVAGVVPALEPGEHFAPDFQDRLRQYGRRFSLDEGEVLRLELQPTTGLVIPR